MTRNWKLLRAVGLAEGASYLLLLGVAMPLKYLAGHPEAVQIVGWVHGLLFIAYLATIALALTRGLPLKLAGLCVVAAVLPFGPFLIDRRLKEIDGATK